MISNHVRLRVSPLSLSEPSLELDLPGRTCTGLINTHGGQICLMPMNQVPPARLELSSSFGGTFFFSLFSCFPFHFAFFFLPSPPPTTTTFSSCFSFFEPCLLFQRTWETALRDTRNSARQAHDRCPARHPEARMLPRLSCHVDTQGEMVLLPTWPGTSALTECCHQSVTAFAIKTFLFGALARETWHKLNLDWSLT